jgi:hypothetical protein
MGSSQDLMACVLRLQLGHEKMNPSKGGPKELIFLTTTFHDLTTSYSPQFFSQRRQQNQRKLF